MGASLAFALTRLGQRDVLLLERRTLAAGATGKTGALLRQHYTNVPEATMAHLSLQTFANWSEVIGGDWGANGYTTMAQADTLADKLGLTAADRLLDLGSGRGWPGLYLAARTGCAVVLADLPLEGLRVAANRATSEGLAARTGVVAAAASALPFRASRFDVVIHTDVLC